MKKILASLLFVPVMAHAEFWTGNNLLENMKGSEVDQIQAYGYVMGVFDTSSGVDHCGNRVRHITVSQVNDVAKRYLEQNPALRHHAADLLVRAALGLSWPCPKKGSGA